MIRHRLFLVGLGVVALLLMWRLAYGQAPIPVVDQPIQAQVNQVVTGLLASEANNATGTHIPGVGAVFSMDLVRGPNTLADKNPFDGTRDWTIYLMQTFGKQMTTLPDNESIAMSVDFYDYKRTINHQLVITTRKTDVADPTKYIFYLNSKPYAEAIAQLDPGLISAPPEILPTASAIATVETPVTATGPISITLDFENSGADAASWANVSGTWQFNNGGYEQTELNRYDLTSYFNQRLEGDIRFAAQMQYVDGNMGGGLIFNAPSNTSKANAHIASYTAGGTFLQYGYFNETGVFQYQGGIDVPTGADGQPHVLAVQAVGDTYSITLDDTIIAEDVPLQQQGGFAGLFVSTSHVVYDNVELESTQP